MLSDLLVGAGTLTIGAAYSGDASFTGSQAAPLTETVSKAPTATTLSASVNPTPTGQTVTIAAAVVSTGDIGTPTGTVTFSIDGTPQTPAQPLTVVGGRDIATFTGASLLSGIQTISATYNGDNIFAASSASTPVTLLGTGNGGPITEFPLPAAFGSPAGITAGPDGNLWFTENGLDALGMINPATDVLTQFPTPNGSDGQTSITAGPDGNLWFTGGSVNQVGMIDPATHAVTEFPIPTADSDPLGIVTGSDGNLWFTEFGGSQIGMIDPATGAVTEFPTTTPDSGPLGITAGPDGNLWFTEESVNQVGMIDPETHVISEFPIPGTGRTPGAITAGSDGNLWFTESIANQVGMINPTSHVVTQFAIPTPSADPVAITAGPDGNLWFTAYNSSQVGAISPTTFAFSQFATPSPASAPVGITAGPDGNLWFTESAGDQIGQLKPGPAATATTLRSSAGPSTFGMTVTFTATVSPLNDPGTPTGAVTFSIDGVFQIAAALAVIGGQDIAQFTDSALGPGMHSITAVYGGDSAFSPSPVATTLAQTVNQAPTTVALFASQNETTASPLVTITAVITTAPDAGNPTGSVEFSSVGGSAQLAPIVVPVTVVAGQVEASLSAPLDPGVYIVTATYLGDSNRAGSSSTPITLTIVSVGTSTTGPTTTPAPTPTSPLAHSPPQSPTIAAVQRSARGLTSISLGFGVALFPPSVSKKGLYHVLGAAKTHGTTVFRTALKLKRVDYDFSSQTLKLTLARPFRGKVEVKIAPGLVAASGASNTNTLTIVVD